MEAWTWITINRTGLDLWNHLTIRKAASIKIRLSFAPVSSRRRQEGFPTTLKRNGSDYSATIFGALLVADDITIWTDVDGVYSSDPRRVKDAVCLERLSYNEAWELAYFGANVLHPRTTLPAMKFSIPICIRNYFAQDAPGTLIAARCEIPADESEKGTKNVGKSRVHRGRVD